MTALKKEIRENEQILKSRVSVSILSFESRSRSFDEVSVSKVTVSTTSLTIKYKYFKLIITIQI